MRAHIGVDAESGLVHTVRGTVGNVNDVVEANALLHGEEAQAFGDAGYQGAHKRDDAKPSVNWNIAMRPGKRAALDKSKQLDQLTEQLERLKASIRASVEHPFRVVKRQFGHVKVRYRGLTRPDSPDRAKPLKVYIIYIVAPMGRRRLAGLEARALSAALGPQQESHAHAQVMCVPRLRADERLGPSRRRAAPCFPWR